MVITPHIVAEINLLGMGLDALGGLYLAYDLLDGKHGPLRIIARTAGYVSLFFIGYSLVLGLSFALVAACGMGLSLVLEIQTLIKRRHHGHPVPKYSAAFGFFRGMVLGLASMTIARPLFGFAFGIVSGIGLAASYPLGFTPARDFEMFSKPHLTWHKLTASLYRALIVCISGVIANFITPAPDPSLWFEFRLGAAAGIVSALVGLFSPSVEWWIENLPARRLGMGGLVLILMGIVLQSLQYWFVVFNVPIALQQR